MFSFTEINFCGLSLVQEFDRGLDVLVRNILDTAVGEPSFKQGALMTRGEGAKSFHRELLETGWWAEDGVYPLGLVLQGFGGLPEALPESGSGETFQQGDDFLSQTVALMV